MSGSPISSDPSVTPPQVGGDDSLPGIFSALTSKNGRITFTNLVSWLLGNSGLGSFARSRSGLVPAAGGGEGDTSRFLREDGSFATPPDTNTTYTPFGGSGSGSRAGLVPAPGATAGTSRFLREDGGFATPPDTKYTVFGGSGSSHAVGLVPDPGATAGTGRFLREDGQFATPTYTFYTAFGGSGSSHAAGLVPDPGATAGTSRFLREDGKFEVPAYPASTSVKSNYTASGPPTKVDDTSKGYTEGSPWQVTITRDRFFASSTALNTAEWTKIDVADHPGYVAGRVYLPFGHGAVATGTATAANTIYLAYGVVKQRIPISQLGAVIITLVAGGNFQLAMYRHNSATAGPGAFALATGSTSTGIADAINASLAGGQAFVEPGPFWFACNQDVAGVVFLALGLNSPAHVSIAGHPTRAIPAGTSNGSQVTGYSTPQTFGTWPADLSAATLTPVTIGRNPMIQFTVGTWP